MKARHSRSFSGSLFRWSSTLLPLAGIVAMGLMWFTGAGVQELEATGTWPVDVDQDGLPDGQERVLGTNSALADTDGDGYSDAYELAAQSSPVAYLDVPAVSDVSVGMTARGASGNGARVLLAAVAVDGSFANKTIAVGQMIGGRKLLIPFQWFAERADSMQIQNPDGSRLLLLDVRVPGSLIQQHRSVTYFAAAAVTGAGRWSNAAVADIALIDGVNCLRVQIDGQSSPAQTSTATSVFRPIAGSDQGVPSSWIPGALCLKQCDSVSNGGGVVTMQVTAAGCSEPWWDGFCPPDCASSVGDSFQTVDPFLLIGG